MNKGRKLRLQRIVLALIVSISIMFLIFTLLLELTYVPAHGEITPLGFNGTYHLGKDGKEKPFTEETSFNPYYDEMVVFTGHFDRDIPANINIIMRIHNLRVKVYQNDTLIYSFGEPGSYASFAKSEGNKWGVFVSSGISTNDVIRFELETCYVQNLKTTYENAITKLCTGYANDLLKKLVLERAMPIFFAFLVFLTGIILLISMLILRILRYPVSKILLDFTLLTIISGIWLLMDFDVLSLVLPYGVFLNILDIWSLSLMPVFFISYLMNFVKGKSSVILNITGNVLLFCSFTYLLLQMFGICDMYEMSDAVSFTIGVAIIIVVLVFITEWRYRRNSVIRFFILSVAMVAAVSFIDIINTFLYWWTYPFFFPGIFFLFILMHVIFMLKRFKDNLAKVRKAKDLEAELLQSKIDIMLSQIKPHFLYNTLASISFLCEADPKLARRTIDNFSDLLRSIFDSLGNKKLLPFEKGIENLKRYLSIEQVRFGDRLNVVFDIHTTDFALPELTLQPIVENAIRHGITKRDEGGTIIIKTEEKPYSVCITVSDDGVGFNKEELQNAARTHSGLENVKNRLFAMCGGSLKMNSTPGEGTVITIEIPKEKVK